MAHIQYVDELVKEYLLFRGFSQTLRTLENDLKIDKDKGFRVDRLTDQIVGHIQTYDLQGLRDLWNHLDRRLFMRLSPSLQPYVRKLELSVLRLYVVNTIQTNKPEKLVDFFDKMAPDLQSQPEWRDWFVLPYLKGAEESPVFGMYFSRQWQDTLLVSLTNFLAIIFQNLTLPTLARYEEESALCSSLQEEIEQLRMRLNTALSAGSTPYNVSSTPFAAGSTPRTASSSPFTVLPPGDAQQQPPHPAHLMDDFYNIAQESSMSSEGQLRSFKNLFGFGGGSGSQHSQQQQQGASGTAAERGRQHYSSTSPAQAGADGRRTSSQAPPADRRRGRSSSLAAATSRTVSSDDKVTAATTTTTTTGGGGGGLHDHQPVKRLGTAPRRSRSPNRTAAAAAAGSTGATAPAAAGRHQSADDIDSCGPDAAAAIPGPFVVQQEVMVMAERASVVTCAVFSPSGRVLAAGDTAGTLTLHTATQANKWGSSSAVECSLRGTVAGLVWLGESDRLLLAATQPGLLTLWDSHDNRPLWEAGPDNTKHLKDRRIMCASVSPSATSAVVSVAPRSRSQVTSSPAPALPPAILCMDIKTAQVETSHHLSPGCTVNGCDVNHNGSLVVCGCSDGCVRILDLRTPDVIATWPAHKGQVFSVRLSHHQDKLYTIGSDNKLACWSLAQTGQRLLEHSLHRQAAGPFMVEGGAAPTLQGGARSVLLRPYGALFALHHNDQYVFTCSTSGSKLYQVSGDEVTPAQQFGRHRQPVVTVDWSAPGGGEGVGTCVTASLDGCVSVTTLAPV